MYDRLFEIFWKPFSLLAKLLLSFKCVQRSRFAPFVLGAKVGRWGERVGEEDLGDLSELSPADRELVRRKASQGKR